MAENQAAEGAKKEKKAMPWKKLSQFQTPDGKIFATQREATIHLRRDKIADALKAVTKGDEALTNWLVENRVEIEKAFHAADPAPRQITPETRAKMKAALEARLGGKK